MGERIVLEGVVAPEKDSGKVYLFSNGGIVDVNKYLQKFAGEEVTITIIKREEP